MRKASPTPVGSVLAFSSGTPTSSSRLADPLDPDAVGAERGDTGADLGEDLRVGPAGLGLDQTLLVLVGEEVGRVHQEGADGLAVHPGDLLGEVGGERDTAGAALLGVPDHRLGVVRTDQDEVEAADPLGHMLQLDQPGLAHRAGVERPDLVVVGVGGAHEAGGVQHLGDVDGTGVDAMAVEPGAVLLEVVAGGTDQDRLGAELAHTEADVGGDAAAADVELVDQEGKETVCSWSATS